MSVCLNHTDTEAVTRCAACGKPLCANCIAVSDNGRDYCSQACYTRGTAAAERSAGVVSEKSSTAKSMIALKNTIIMVIVCEIFTKLYLATADDGLDCVKIYLFRYVNLFTICKKRAILKEQS